MQPTKSIIKFDLNFLNYPLWFQVSHANETLHWNDGDYQYHSSYRTPDQLDMLFLMFFLLRSQQQDYQPKLVFSRYEILKNCGCPINPQYLRRLEDSLKRWLGVSLKFHQNFNDTKEYRSKAFIILDHFQLRSKDQKLEVLLNADFLQQLQKSVYFKYIDFHYYRSLRRPVSRRLFEILNFAFKTQQSYKLPLVELGHKLTLYSRKRTRADGTQEKILYPSDVLHAVKAALEEINTLATNTEHLRQLGMDPKEVYAITYHIDQKRKQIEFQRAALSHLFDELTQDPNQQLENETHREPQLSELLGYLKRQSRPLKELVSQYYYHDGFDYVKWNIFYANRNGARNYVSYLRLCLQHNWAQEFREEYERMFTSDAQSIDRHKITALIRVAEQADHLRMPDGQKFRIKRVFPNGAIEISNRNYKMDFVLSPAQAYACRFETEQPEHKNSK